MNEFDIQQTIFGAQQALEPQGYEDVKDFMKTSEGKKLTRAAVDAAIRSEVKQGQPVNSKTIVDAITKVARRL